MNLYRKISTLLFVGTFYPPMLLAAPTLAIANFSV